MKIFSLVRAEFARLWATPMSRLAFIALMIVPLLYGGLYLWANQDPYSKLDQVPVALVVDDTGATMDGEQVNYGHDVADELIEDGTFGWTTTDAAGAARGVADGTFDFSVTLPADFSEALASSSGDDPHQAEVLLTTNDANSYLAGTIGEQATKTIQTQIVRTVNKQSAQTMLDGIAEIRTKMIDAHDGTEKLIDGARSAMQGASDAHDGAVKLEDGASTAQSGAGDLAEGNKKLATGAHTLADGIGTLQSQTAQLPAKTAQLADGAAQVAKGNAQIASVADTLAADSTAIHSRLSGAREEVASALAGTDLSADEIAAIMERVDRVGGLVDDANSTVQSTTTQLDTLATGSQAVADGARQLADSTPALVSGIGTLHDGANTLASGADTAATGAATLHTGLGTLTDGISTLGDGLGSLDEGLGELHEGLVTLGDGLQKGVDQLPNSSAELRTTQASTIANPVGLTNTAVTSAGTYGAGLAPFFVSLAAWIGIYALFLILKPFSSRAITAINRPIKITLAGWLTPALLGSVQMLALFGIVAGTLGFSVSNPLPTYGMMALASMTFAAIIMALNVWLGSVGQFLGLILMVVQLVTAGGTFPWQTLPAPLAWLHNYLPMSYAVDGMRQLMYGGDLAKAGTDAIVLACVLLGALVASAIGVGRMTRFRTLRDLQPSLIG
ncbi:MAG: YhgE/Pip family protein [Mycetocola sp.]